MKAVQYREIGKGPEVVEIDTPNPDRVRSGCG